MFYIVNADGSRRVNTAFESQQHAEEALGGPVEADRMHWSMGIMIEWQDDDDDYIGDHTETIVIANGIEVEEFDTEIIYDESGIEVGETSTKLPILEIVQ